IGVNPSFLGVDSFFMTETLFLDLMALAVWLTLRARRKKILSSFSLASFIWILASFTRIVVLPFGGLLIAYMLIAFRHKFRMGLVPLGMFIAVAIPASWHSYQQLHVAAPLGFASLNKIYHKIDHVHMRFVTEKGVWQVGLPSYFVNPLAPFGTY